MRPGLLSVVASVASATTLGLVMALLVPPPRRLAARVRPYLLASPNAGRIPASSWSGSSMASVFGPIVGSAAAAVGRVLDRSTEEVLARRLRQAGLFPNLSDSERVAAFRARQLATIGKWTFGALAVGVVLGGSGWRIATLTGLGLVVGASRQRAALGSAIETRTERLRIEIYTINQLLAMRVKAGGGVVQAVAATVKRGRGAVVEELSDVLRLHRSGMRASEAFRRVAEASPEPFCARTYRLLAAADERGADLAESLLALSEDVRESRREALRRSATKRRAAMLFPTIAVLAPVLLLFVAAPLPYLVLGWR